MEHRTEPPRRDLIWLYNGRAYVGRVQRGKGFVDCFEASRRLAPGAYIPVGDRSWNSREVRTIHWRGDEPPIEAAT